MNRRATLLEWRERARHVVPSKPMTATVALIIGCVSASADGYERDVHFGLTRWLAMQAGFTGSQAQAIAIGDVRVDGGSMDFQTLTLQVACAGTHVDDARRIQQLHFPSSRAIPVPPADRSVVAGDHAAREALQEFMQQVAGKEGLLLGKLGEALHPLQDSYAHAGIPSVPAPGDVECDRLTASSNPPGDGSPHDADLTHRAPARAVAMAEATYEALRRYPSIDGVARPAADWKALVPQVEGFAAAKTKAAKAAWFDARGNVDSSFLTDISLPDGPDYVPSGSWKGDRFPTLSGDRSTQYDVPKEALSFVNDLLLQWFGKERSVDVAGAAMGFERSRARNAMPVRQVAARMTLLRLRDHGRFASLAHKKEPLSSAELQLVEREAGKPGAVVDASSFNALLFPLQAIGPSASPLLPYVVQPLAGTSRFVAIARLRHLPYDELVLILELRQDRWTLVDIGIIVGQ